MSCLFRILSTGAPQQSIAESFRLGKSTVNKIFNETCIAIWDSLKDIYVKPPDHHDFEQIRSDFWELWNFPNCLGAIDGKHIKIRAPPKTGSQFFNYKGYFSTVLLAVVDAKYRFSMVDIGAYGRQSDGGTFSSSTFGQKLIEGQVLMHSFVKQVRFSYIPSIFQGN